MARAGDELDDRERQQTLAVATRVVHRATTLLSLPLLLLGARDLFQLERTSAALSEQQRGGTLVTVGLGMLLLGGAAWLLDRRTERRGWVRVLTVGSVVWPLWITFVHWYDGR